MSFKPSGWMWVLFAAASLLVLLLVLLLRHDEQTSSAEEVVAPAGSGGMRSGPGLRKPFPAGGELDGVQRPGTLQPRKRLAPDPQFQGPQRQ